MGTSLAQQLRKLAVPQTSIAVEEKRKVSLLFNSKEAATFDRDTFYDLGISGLEDLKKLNPEFAQFEKTLFDLSSKNLQRVVQTADVNSKLDQEITKFLCFLSPYFLLNSSHKALEWLIQRFQVHKFNIDQLLMLILPYHSTNTFIRVLQLVKINDPNHRWYWLHRLQKAGVPLAQKTLLNHCSSSNWFMSFVCQIPVLHLKICGEQSRTLHTLCTFCCTTVVGRVMHSEISEIHVTTILKLLIETLLSPFIEFSCMSVVIAAQLVKSTKLSEDFLKVLVNKLSKNPHKSLQTECTAVVALVYFNQQETMKIIPEKALFNFAKSGIFIPSLQKLIDDGGQVNNLLTALVKNSTQTILKRKNEMMLEKFLDSLIATIKFNENTVERIILIAIQSYINRESESSHEAMDVDNSETTFQPILQWFSNFVRNLELQYPTVFDTVVKTTLEAVQVEGTRNNLLELLGFVPKINFQISIMDMLEKLHHPNISMRVEGVKFLIAKFDILKEEDKEFVQNIMRTRLQEDNHKIIEAVLKCPVSSLASVVGEEYFVMQMIKIASKYWYTSKISNNLKNKVLSYLCSDVSSNQTAVWFAALPYLLPKSNEDVKLAEWIIKSEICSKNKFILAIHKDVPEGGSVTADLLCSIVMKVMTREDVVPSVSDLLDLVNVIPIFKTEAVYKFITCILLTTASSKESVEVKWKVLDVIKEYYTSCKINYEISSSLSSFGTIQACMKATYKKQLPIAGMLHGLLSFTNSAQLPETVTCQHWWHISSEDKNTRNSSMLFFIRIFESLLSGCMDNQSAPKEVSKRYIEGLKNLFKNTFQNLEAQLGFLSNLWVVHEIQGNYPDLNYELQLRSLLLARSLLKKTQESISWTANIKDESIIPLLLVSLSCPLLPIRMAALECLAIAKYSLGAQLHEKGYHCLLVKLLDHEEELKIDAEQISVVLYKVLSPDPAVMSNIRSSQRSKLVTIERALFDCVLKDNTPWHIRSALLKILAFVNSKEILKMLVPLGNKILTNAKSNSCQLDIHQSAVLCNILNRFDPSTCDSLPKDAWRFFEAALLDFKSVVYHGRKITCPSLITMNKITKDVFEALVDYRQDTVRVLVHVATEADSPDIISTVGHIVKKIVLDCKYVVMELEKMKEAQSPAQSPLHAKRQIHNSNVRPSIELIKSTAWREGTSLLELIQYKKKLHNVHLLLPVLFDLLKRCLEFEEQAPVEYNKQLILSCILHTCSKFSSDSSFTEVVSGSVLNVELVVQCIRASQNPQTHHHALLVLSQLAEMIPEQVLHNIMAIFTFMGSSILRQDDSYSFQIISKVVDSVIPILVKANDAGVDLKELYDPVAAVLRVFVDALVDIPEHRQIPLFYKLIVTLGSDKFLWLLLSLVIESQVKHKTGPDQFKDGMLPKKLEFAVNLSLKYHPPVVINSGICLMQYLKSLPVEKEQKDLVNSKLQGTPNVTKLFDVVNSSKSEYHHFKYALIIFLSGMIGNPNFIKQVAALSPSEVETMKPLYSLLIECVLQHIQVCVNASESNAGKPAAKFWKCMLGQSYDLLDKVNALLLSDMFLRVISSLLNNPVYTVSRKAMELMNARLQNEEFFSTCKTEDLLSLVNPLMEIINGIREDSSADQQLNQQTALASMKLLARLMGAKYSEFFNQILERLTCILIDSHIKGNVLASALLCGAELCSCLKEFAVGNLPKFVKALLTVLKHEKKVENPDVVLLAIVTAVYKVVESLPNFLSPYLERLLIQVTILSSRLSQKQQTQKITPIVTKLELIKQKIASEVPLRVLVPVVETSYFHLLKKKKYGAIGPLMVVLSGSFSGVTSADFNHLRSKLSSFFLAALQFRSDNGNECLPEVIDAVEGHVVKALVALVLKLSESSFRPMYYNLFHWATAVEVHKERLITFYRVSHKIAECLKGLFILFAGHFMQNAATLLGQINLSKSKNLLYGSGLEAEEKSALLLDVLLKTLHSVFLYDSAQFLNKERFDTLMQPLVDQLENTLGGLEAYRERITKLLSPCIVQFAVVTADDSLWKQLNYQILLKTRHSLPVVRLMALETVCAVARKLGDDFLPQLPETVPFLAELMEDEEEEVEAACVKVVQELEEVLGEPLKKYF